MLHQHLFLTGPTLCSTNKDKFISCLLLSIPSSSPCEVANAINRAELEVQEQYASQAKHCLRPRERLWRFYLLMNYPFFIGTTCFLDSVLLLCPFSTQPPGDEGTIPPPAAHCLEKRDINMKADVNGEWMGTSRCESTERNKVWEKGFNNRRCRWHLD